MKYSYQNGLFFLELYEATYTIKVRKGT